MSNLIYAAWRHPGDALAETTLRAVADRIIPKTLTRGTSSLAMGSWDGLCLTAPTGAAVGQGTAGHLGAFAGPFKGWEIPGTPVPDGTFALIRSNEAVAELCSDDSGSRTLWYAMTDRHFFASTSQRALVCLLEGLSLNRSALAWFISSGSLGPSDSWDGRLSRLPGRARLVLHRSTWQVELQVAPLEFRPERMGATECQAEMTRILREALQSYDFTSSRWMLPLSGGFDCRFILAVLHESGLRPRTATWGLAASITQPGNDAFVARDLANHYGLHHDYLHTDRAEDPPEEVVDRFLSASGGTTDQLFPYLDGLRLWSSFADQGIDGVIRGDEGFGWIPLNSEAHARSSVGMTLLRDFLDPAQAVEIAGRAQEIPQHLQRHPAETLATYRDRLYHGFRIPVGLAALNDVKAPFVEIASPLLSRHILAFVRRMPDPLRTDKALFRRIATSAGPHLPYATMAADDDGTEYLRSGPYLRWLEEELESGGAQHLLPSPFRKKLAGHLREAPSVLSPSRSLRSALKRIIPSRWIQIARSRMGPLQPGGGTLALRAGLASRMIRILEADGRHLDSLRRNPR